MAICHPIAPFGLTEPLRRNRIAHFSRCLGEDLAYRCCEPLIAVVISLKKSAPVGGIPECADGR
jgi:hypothetical protein